MNAKNVIEHKLIFTHIGIIQMANCAGIIVFRDNQTVLVKTKRGNYSFPKGKREGKKKHRELVFDCAVRETQEETGLTLDQLDLLPDKYVEEVTDKDVVSVRYYIAFLKPNIQHTFTFDPDELASAEWVNVDTIATMDGMKPRRKLAFQQALDIVNEWKNSQDKV